MDSGRLSGSSDWSQETEAIEATVESRRTSNTLCRPLVASTSNMPHQRKPLLPTVSLFLLLLLLVSLASRVTSLPASQAVSSARRLRGSSSAFLSSQTAARSSPTFSSSPYHSPSSSYSPPPSRKQWLGACVQRVQESLSAWCAAFGRVWRVGFPAGFANGATRGMNTNRKMSSRSTSASPQTAAVASEAGLAASTAARGGGDLRRRKAAEQSEEDAVREFLRMAADLIKQVDAPTCPPVCVNSIGPMRIAFDKASGAVDSSDWPAALAALESAENTARPCHVALVMMPSYLAYPMGEIVHLVEKSLEVVRGHVTAPPAPAPSAPPPLPPPLQKGAACAGSPEATGEGLLGCATGYAEGVTGGAGGLHYVVSQSWDNPSFVLPGTLRYAIEAYYGQPMWITFAEGMTIDLTEPLYIGPDVTIDGRGAGGPVVLRGAMLAIVNVSNVIIHGITVEDVKGDHDAIPIRNSRMVWVDHCRLVRAFRGLVDVVYGATQVTVSYSYFHNPPHVATVQGPEGAGGGEQGGGGGGGEGREEEHVMADAGYVMLLGESDDDTASSAILVTVVGNWFDSSHQRQPHIRWGKAHVVNNLFTNWTYYCLGGRVHGQIRSESNVFIAGDAELDAADGHDSGGDVAPLSASEVTPWFEGALETPGFDDTANIHSLGDDLRNGATFHQFLNGPIFDVPYDLDVLPTRNLPKHIRQHVGPVGLIPSQRYGKT